VNLCSVGGWVNRGWPGVVDDEGENTF
jgi:hypothetical protein